MLWGLTEFWKWLTQQVGERTTQVRRTHPMRRKAKIPRQMGPTQAREPSTK
jgi:hypothetical protein